ncbi:MAG: DUF3025 domain-containing protein [Proteobacteria bacterium]|nr:DUF3025 domain-containing protein [Pseudomonadota bacterium]MDA0983355.1 DUF3025 domain-containing protein [Pseudomonadota bacterium]
MEAGLEQQGRTTISTAPPDWPDADFSHPVFDPVRAWLERLARDRWPTLEDLNGLARESEWMTGSGRPIRFVPPQTANAYYEVHLSETGEVHTRANNWHDLFNALAWLAFPRTKARINAMHAAQIPKETGMRGKLRDMLTLFDEGGAVVACANPKLEALVREHRWKELFWARRADVLAGLRIHVLGHALLEMALRPRPGLTCKVIFIGREEAPDAAAERWLAAHDGKGTTRDLVSLPVFGYPGWLPGSDEPAFYNDERYFRPFRKAVPAEKNVVCP